jgi:hypothetical protein
MNTGSGSGVDLGKGRQKKTERTIARAVINAGRTLFGLDFF